MTKIKEVWKSIPGHEGKYEVSILGRIKSLNRIVPHSRKGTQEIKERILIPQNTGRYLQTSFRVDGRRVSTGTHRIIAIVFIPNPENKPEVNHKNGIKTDNRIDNLEWVTASENMIHAINSGLNDIRGEKNKSAKLSSKQVLEIRALKGKVPVRKLAIKYKITRVSIRSIQNMITWRHL